MLSGALPPSLLCLLIQELMSWLSVNKLLGLAKAGPI